MAAHVKGTHNASESRLLIERMFNLARLSTFASKTPAVAGVLLIGLHYTAFRDAIREDSRQTTPSRGVTLRKKFAAQANVESRVKGAFQTPEGNGAVGERAK